MMVVSALGCCGLDRYDDDYDDDCDLPPRPRFGDRLRDRDDRDDREPDDRPRFGDLRWIGPSRESPPINPSVPNLPPQRDPYPARAEDPSWRNR
jgi:hypothetical protein